MQPTIGILNADLGNLRSVSNAVDSLGFDHRIIREASEFNAITHLIIPGVGSFPRAMQHLEELRLKSGIVAFAQSGRPVLGICLGMQILAQHGEELSPTPGLGLIEGSVRLLPQQLCQTVPHVGWNTVTFTHAHPVLAGIKNGVDYYFVHSYFLDGGAAGQTYGVTEHGLKFPSIAGRGNVFGVQFHPEKSQTSGLKLLENFCGWDGRC